LIEGLSIIGARKPSSYGLSLAQHFAYRAASKGVVVISGGAYGCDSAAHRGAMDAGGRTIVILGGGCDRPYPASHVRLFQEVVNCGGIVLSEYEWSHPPVPYTFRSRNRLIACLGRATLITEAGVPSGTFSTADEALAVNRDVLAVPGPISSHRSAGANRLIQQGAYPVIDDESFDYVLEKLFVTHNSNKSSDGIPTDEMPDSLLVEILREGPLSLESLVRSCVQQSSDIDVSKVLIQLSLLETDGHVKRFPDGLIGLADGKGALSATITS
jgi:DNA processing protein